MTVNTTQFVGLDVHKDSIVIANRAVITDGIFSCLGGWRLSSSRMPGSPWTSGAHAARWLYASPGVLWCGNVVSDPYLFLVNVIAPLAAVCTASLAWRSIRARCWSTLSAAALVVFLATSTGLATEGILLQRDYGIDILCGVWWLPGG